MRYFSYNDYKTDPSVDPYVATKSEDDIRKEYFPYWEKKMIEKFGEEYYRDNYCFLDCLDDWIVVNLAWEVDKW